MKTTKEALAARILRLSQAAEEKKEKNITVESLLDGGSFEEAIELLKFESIQEIYLKGDHIIEGNIEWLKKLFSCSVATELHIHRIEGFNNVFSLLKDILKENTNLLKLDLSHNKIDEEGAKLICEILEENKCLQTLILNNNLLGNDGANELSKVLKTNTTLKIFGISNNQIGSDGTPELIEMLKFNNGLTSLDIQNNSISCDKLVEEGLAKNYFITSLSFRSCTDTRDNLIERNKDLVKKCAGQLETLKNFTLKTLNYFKHCDKDLLLKSLDNDKDFLQETAETYLTPKFYMQNFFKLAGVCKVLPKGNSGIHSLPKFVIEEIVSFISIEEHLNMLKFAGENVVEDSSL